MNGTLQSIPCGCSVLSATFPRGLSGCLGCLGGVGDYVTAGTEVHMPQMSLFPLSVPLATPAEVTVKSQVQRRMHNPVLTAEGLTRSSHLCLALTFCLPHLLSHQQKGQNWAFITNIPLKMFPSSDMKTFSTAKLSKLQLSSPLTLIAAPFLDLIPVAVPPRMPQGCPWTVG